MLKIFLVFFIVNQVCVSVLFDFFYAPSMCSFKMSNVSSVPNFGDLYNKFRITFSFSVKILTDRICKWLFVVRFMS